MSVHVYNGNIIVLMFVPFNRLLVLLPLVILPVILFALVILLLDLKAFIATSGSLRSHDPERVYRSNPL